MTALTTAAAVKAYLAITSTNVDALITSLIARESRHVADWVGRALPTVTRTLRRLNGSGTRMLTLPDTPILSISAVQIAGVAVAASADGVAAGYVHDDNAILLIGDIFPRGLQNVTVSWVAGYRESETADIPAGNTPTLTPTTGGLAVTVVSVVDADAGTALTEVDSAPATGQFSFASGVFSFASADAGVSVTMTYDYVPLPIEQAVIEMVGLDLKQRDNLGISSKTLAGESVSYSDKGMTASVREMLAPFRQRVPA